MEQIEQAMVRFGIDEGILSAALAIREKVGAHGLGHVSPNRLSLCMIVKNERERSCALSEQREACRQRNHNCRHRIQ